MSPTRPSFRSHRLTRMMRASVVRWVLVVLLAPLLTLGALGGATFLVHVDDHHGLHLHAIETGPVGDSTLAPEAGRHAHECFPGHDHSSLADSSPGEPCSLPDGVLISVPDHEQLGARTTNLSRTVHLFAAAMVADLVPPSAPDAVAQLGLPSGCFGRTPLHLVAVSSSDRIVRTSCALLI